MAKVIVPAPAFSAGDIDPNEVNATFKSTNPDHRMYLREITVAELEKAIIDPMIQRNIQETEVAKIVRKYNRAAVGVLTYSHRRDGVDSVIDGQQRRHAMMTLLTLGKLDPNEIIQVMVHEGLSIEEEAALFLLLNDRRSVDAIRRFKTRLVAKDEQALNIQGILTNLDIPINSRGVQAIETLDKIYEQRGGAARLHWVLSVIQRVYDTDRRGGCYDGRVIVAFGMIHAAFSEILDEERFITVLYETGDRVQKLRGAGRMKQELTKGNIAFNMAEVLRTWYNDSRPRTNKLPRKLPAFPRKTLEGIFETAQANADQNKAVSVSKTATKPAVVKQRSAAKATATSAA